MVFVTCQHCVKVWWNSEVFVLKALCHGVWHVVEIFCLALSHKHIGTKYGNRYLTSAIKNIANSSTIKLSSKRKKFICLLVPQILYTSTIMYNYRLWFIYSRTQRARLFKTDLIANNLLARICFYAQILAFIRYTLYIRK